MCKKLSFLFFIVLFSLFTSCKFVANNAAARTDALLDYKLALGDDLCSHVKKVSVRGNSVLSTSVIDSKTIEVSLFKDFSYKDVKFCIDLEVDEKTDISKVFLLELNNTGKNTESKVSNGFSSYFTQEDILGNGSSKSSNDYISVKCNDGHEVKRIRIKPVTIEEMQSKWKNDESYPSDYANEVKFKTTVIEFDGKSTYVFPIYNPSLKKINPGIVFLVKTTNGVSFISDIGVNTGANEITVTNDITAITVNIPESKLSSMHIFYSDVDFIVYFNDSGVNVKNAVEPNLTDLDLKIYEPNKRQKILYRNGVSSI